MADLHHHHPPQDPGPAGRPPEPALDAGSQALSEALRSSFAIVKVVMVILVFVFLGSGIFTVREGERAVILRFGKPRGEGDKALLLPGLHWSWPYPIEEYRKIPITAIQRIVSSVGYYYVTPEQELAGMEPPFGPSLNPAIDGYVVTADGNIVHCRATVQYTISDPINYIFNFSNASNAVQHALDNALIWAASTATVDDILTRDVIGFSDAVRRRFAALAAQQNLGIVIEQCSVQSVPPRQLKDAFANVLRAEVNRSKALNEARSHENQVLSRASAEARGIINTAESERSRVVAEVASRARQFNELLPKYNSNPRLFVEQRLTETIGVVLTNVQDKVFLPESPEGRTRELRLLLNREPPKPKLESPKP